MRRSFSGLYVPRSPLDLWRPPTICRSFEPVYPQKSPQYDEVNPFIETVFYRYTRSVFDSEPFTLHLTQHWVHTG